MKHQALFPQKDKSKKKSVVCCNSCLALFGLNKRAIFVSLVYSLLSKDIQNSSSLQLVLCRLAPCIPS